MLTKNQVSKIIADKGIKKARLAKAVGITRQCLYKWLNGYSTLSIATQSKIEKFIRDNYKIDC